MNILRPLRAVPTLAAALLLAGSSAQTTKEGYALTWDKTITVVPDSMSNDRFRLPAFTITVYECNGDDAMSLWKTDMKTKSQEVSGSKPVKAVGAMFLAASAEPMLVLAESRTEKKAGAAKLTIAFAQNDSTPAANQQAAEQVAREMAVMLNKTVVQKQIDTYTKSLDKTSEKLTDAKEDAEKNRANISKANADLAKQKSKVSKVQADNAKMHGEVTGLEKKFAITNDPKDLQKLTKAREKLSKGEAELAKMMKAEAKAQEKVNDHQSDSPDHAKTQEQHTMSKADTEKTINELKRKLDNIR
jgi:hypothetical protein